jgi:hypothetical protein
MRTVARFRIISVFLALILVGGCTTGKIDWSSRVGSYDYDRAITDMGPPDRVAKLSDGTTTVAEWLTHRGHNLGSSWLYGPPYISPIYDSPTPDRFIRLTFEPGGKLKDWKKVAR